MIYPDSVVRRFWSKVDRSKPDECWHWTASTQRRGYGQISINGKPEIATRVAFQIVYGDIPDGLFICHWCDNPSCVNPSHLFLGTPADNIHDMDAKGRRVNAPRRGENHHAAKLTEQQARAIRDRALAGEDQHALGAEFNVSNVTVSAIKKGRLWGWLE